MSELRAVPRSALVPTPSVTIPSGLVYRLGCINPAGKDRPNADKSGEYLLFDRVGPVLGHRIQQRVKHANGQPDTFADIYVFRKEPAAHIKEFLLRNGHGTQHEDQARLVDYIQSNHWLFNNQGERIRIVNAAGVELAVYDIPANTCAVLPAAPKRIIIPAAGVAAVGAFGEVR